MSRRAAEAVFTGQFLLCDIRGLLRDSAPHHRLSEQQKEEAARALGRLEKQVAILKEELLR